MGEGQWAVHDDGREGSEIVRLAAMGQRETVEQIGNGRLDI
jgi:hypothetical protein